MGIIRLYGICGNDQELYELKGINIKIPYCLPCKYQTNDLYGTLAAELMVSVLLGIVELLHLAPFLQGNK